MTADSNGYWRLTTDGIAIAEFHDIGHGLLVQQIMEYIGGKVSVLDFVEYAPYGVVASLAGGILDAAEAQRRRAETYAGQRDAAKLIFATHRRDRRVTAYDAPKPICTAYPLNGCAHPQFCKIECTGQPRLAQANRAEDIRAALATPDPADMPVVIAIPIGRRGEH